MSNGPQTKKDLMKGLGLKETSNASSIKRMKDQNIIKMSKGNILVACPENEWDFYGDRKKLQNEMINRLKESIKYLEEQINSGVFKTKEWSRFPDIEETKKEVLAEQKKQLKQQEEHIGDPNYMPKQRYDQWYLF